MYNTVIKIRIWNISYLRFMHYNILKYIQYTTPPLHHHHHQQQQQQQPPNPGELDAPPPNLKSWIRPLNHGIIPKHQIGYQAKCN